MRKILTFILVACSFTANTQNIDVTHYQYSVHLNDQNDSVDIVAMVKFIYLKQGEISLDLTNIKSDGHGMRISHVSLFSDFVKETQYVHKNDKLIIQPKYYEVGDSDDVLVHYKGVPSDGLIISKNSYSERTFFADNWPNRAHNWLVCNDRPEDKASFIFIIVAPKHYNVISNGIKVTDTLLVDNNKMTTWREDIPQPTKVMVIGVAKFATKTFNDSPENVPVSAWVYPQDSIKGFYDYALTPGIVKFFSDYIAPFPYKKLANVQSKTIFGGMENAGCIFYAENSVTGDRSEEDLYAHEIAHQWFGDAASEKSFAHLWLSEGFATYFTDLYFEYKYGKEAAIKRLQKEREEAIVFAKTSTHAVVDSTKDLMSLLNANSYQKGAWVLHMLRAEVGDTVFHKIIQAYYNQYKGGNAETRDFEIVAEKVSGKDLKWFFDQWLYKAGVPKLKISKTNTNEGVMLTIEQLQQNIYQFTLPVSIESTITKEKVTNIRMTERKKSVLLSKGKMLKVVIDPDRTLLYEEVK